jgi:hypothetical protein
MMMKMMMMMTTAIATIILKKGFVLEVQFICSSQAKVVAVINYWRTTKSGDSKCETSM